MPVDKIVNTVENCQIIRVFRVVNFDALQCTSGFRRDVKMTWMTWMTLDVTVLLTLLSPVPSTHFRGAHFWFEPADDWTPNQPVVS